MFRNPRGSAMTRLRRVLWDQSQPLDANSTVDQFPLPLHQLALLLHPAVVAWEDFDKAFEGRWEVVHDLVGDVRSCVEQVPVDQVAEKGDVLVIHDRN